VLRSVSVVIIFVFGLSLLIPQITKLTENLFNRLSSVVPSQHTSNSGFGDGVILGLSLGLVWTPCVGPIIASVITLAATSSVNLASVFVTLAYSMGTAIPMFIIMYGGRKVFTKMPWVANNTVTIQKIFGVLMILTAFAIHFNLDRKFQTYVLNVFPDYGTNLTQLEDNDIVQNELNNLTIPQPAQPYKSIFEKTYPDAPALVAGGEWFNSAPLTLEELKGNVVIVDFWTYTCINCIRTLPYLVDWYEKYHDQGLEIIGVHTPEFEFEKNPANVKKAIEDFGITYPVMQDNDFATWQNYSNRYWPAKYFINANGKVVNSHFGEGDYDESEMLIQELLEEAGMGITASEVNNPTYSIESETPETYVGYARIANFASKESIAKDSNRVYSSPDTLKKNQIAFDGEWIATAEYSAPEKGALLLINYESKDVYLVMRPEVEGQESRVRILLDGVEISIPDSGADVVNGIVTVDTDRLYHVVSAPVSSGTHILTLEFLDGSVEVFAFTFG